MSKKQVAAIEAARKGKVVATMHREGLKATVDREDFAWTLATWRYRQGLTQVQAARKFGMSRYTIIRIEQAKPISWITAYRVFNQLAEELRKEGSHE